MALFIHAHCTRTRHRCASACRFTSRPSCSRTASTLPLARGGGGVSLSGGFTSYIDSRHAPRAQNSPVNVPHTCVQHITITTNLVIVTRVLSLFVIVPSTRTLVATTIDSSDSRIDVSKQKNVICQVCICVSPTCACVRACTTY